MELNIKLIAEVRARPNLWDIRAPNYTNRKVVDKEWGEVSNVLGFSKETTKTRWKNLRDNFRRELKKEKAALDGHETVYSKRKWIYYNQLHFLRDIMDVQNREASPQQQLHAVALKTQDELDLDEEVQGLCEVMVSDEESDYTQEINSPITQYVTKKKRKREEKQMLIKIEDGDDDDINFLKSILPYFKQLPPIRKLHVRSEFERVLARELGELEPTSTSTAPSTSTPQCRVFKTERFDSFQL